ncbi:MAG: DUF2975 domain-containing protein [Pseudomonadota bacterium]
MNNIARIKTISRLMEHFCLIVMIALPMWVIWFWTNADQYLAELSFARESLLLDMQYIELYQLVLAGGLSMLSILVLVYGISHLRRLFVLFQQGEFFSEHSARHLHIFGLTLFISALLKPVVSAALSLILTMGNPPGQKSVVVEFGSREISMIFIAGTILVITWILREGQKLAAENAEFV